MQREISVKTPLETHSIQLMMLGVLQQLIERPQVITMQKKKSKKLEIIPGLMDLAIQGMLDDIDTREKVAHSSYKDKEQLDFQFLLTKNYYVNPSNIHICFPIKIKKKSSNNSDIDGDLITVNIFLAHWVKEISITKYGSDKELPPTFSPYELYQYSDQMLIHLPSDALKTIQKTHLYNKKPSINSTDSNNLYL